MNKKINEIRRFLFTCSGEDYYILKRCKTKIQVWFAAIGFFVLLIFFGCFISASFFTYSLFNGALLASLPIGFFWGTMVVIMYLLLLHTISPAIIPLAAKKKRKKGTEEIKPNFLSLSMFLRLSFMMLLAVIIAQPLNVYLLQSSISTSLQKHKLQERVKLYASTNQSLIYNELELQKDFNRIVRTKSLIIDENLVNSQVYLINSKIVGDSVFLKKATLAIKQLEKFNNRWTLSKNEKVKQQILLIDINSLLENELQSDQNFIESIESKNVSQSVKKEFDEFKINVSKLINDKLKNYYALNTLLERSNFYVKTIQLLLVQNPLSWIITILVCLVFLIPIGLKYKARDISAKMFLENNNEDLQLIRLRQELINTTDFNWLEKKIKNIDASEIRTADYYFQRMLVEHKIILHEYDDTKKSFSNILTEKIKSFNKRSKEKLNPFLEKLRIINKVKYQEFNSLINQEYKNEIVVKYEYWLDCPFRTKRVQKLTIINDEVGLLDFLYDKPEEDENL